MQAPTRHPLSADLTLHPDPDAANDAREELRRTADPWDRVDADLKDEREEAFYADDGSDL